jgi:hypothetical protein
VNYCISINLAGCLFDLLFNPEDGGSTFLWNWCGVGMDWHCNIGNPASSLRHCCSPSLPSCSFPSTHTHPTPSPYLLFFPCESDRFLQAVTHSVFPCGSGRSSFQWKFTPVFDLWNLLRGGPDPPLGHRYSGLLFCFLRRLLRPFLCYYCYHYYCYRDFPCYIHLVWFMYCVHLFYQQPCPTFGSRFPLQDPYYCLRACQYMNLEITADITSTTQLPT